MRDIIRGREIVADGWRYAGEAGSGPEVLSLEVLLAAVTNGDVPDASARRSCCASATATPASCARAAP